MSFRADGARVRLVKAALAGLLILALGAMWTNRAFVADAYRSDEPAASVRLSGVDLAFRATEIGPTPYRVPSAPDTRRAPRIVVFEPGQAAPAPPPSLAGGDATLRGTVSGPDGPVPGAVVRIERHTDHGSISVDTSTDDEGRWVLAPLAGGRYRVRAWLPGQLTMGRSEVRFVGDDEVATFDFSLWGIDPAPAFEFVDGGAMYEGSTATVALVLTWRSIDGDGLVVINPLPGAEVTVETTAQVGVTSGQPLVTGSDGVARVQLRCVPTGVPPLSAEPTDETVDIAMGPGLRTQLQTQTQNPVAPGPGGTLTARSGTTIATFALPGCLPPPGPAPGSEPDTGPSTTGDPADQGATSDA